jgi:hypothetical protein
VKRWPAVLSEEETLDEVLAGRSIARYGDGEFKLCQGASIKSQQFEPKLGRRLRAILLERSKADCIVAIPNLNVPTKPFWDGFKTPKTTALFDMKRVYGSAFISRPDSAPWIHQPRYWRKVESLWKGQEVTLVRGSGKSLTAGVLASAKAVNEIMCARQHAWAEREELLEKIGRPRRVLLCCGPTATVLAADLAERGVHAIDLGHIGMWFKRLDKSALDALEIGRAEERAEDAADHTVG